ncbi:MAG: hypothetical protein GYA36_07785 [Veillonellaceae bacterium]|jgi:hypothetical protein|nr:hypothetical protein [Veillonellaceae bacterium]
MPYCKFASGYWHLGNAYKKAGNKKEAVIAYENFIKYAKDTDSRVKGAKTILKQLTSQ